METESNELICPSGAIGHCTSTISPSSFMNLSTGLSADSMTPSVSWTQRIAAQRLTAAIRGLV
jgi:hypothetical protein